MQTLPTTSKALQIKAYDLEKPVLEVGEIALPALQPGEVLIRIKATPVNPSDLMFVRGMYGVKKALPVVPGFEASGTVVASGPGVLGRLYTGRIVACSADPKRHGTWSEYMITQAKLCMPLPKGFDPLAGSMLIVNPLTAVAMCSIAAKRGAKAVIHTASGSLVGSMMEVLGKHFGLRVIHVVRRSQQRDELRAKGFGCVLGIDQPDFADELKRRVREYQASIAFDAIAGPLVETLADALPKHGEVYVYGGLSLKSAQVSVGALVFEDKVVRGFWLATWLNGMNAIRAYKVVARHKVEVEKALLERIHAQVSMSEAASAILKYEGDMSAGKILICP